MDRPPRPPTAAASGYNYREPPPAYYGYPGTSPGYAHGFPGFHLAPQPYYGAPPGSPYAAAQGLGHLIPGSPQIAFAASAPGYDQGLFAAATVQGLPQGAFAAAASAPGFDQGPFPTATVQGMSQGPFAAAAASAPGLRQGFFATASVPDLQQGTFAAPPGCFPLAQDFQQGTFAAPPGCFPLAQDFQQGTFAAPPGCFPLAQDFQQKTHIAPGPGHLAADWQEKVGGHHTSLSSQPGEVALLYCANASTHPEQEELLSESEVNEVWRHNCGETFTEIKKLIARNNLVCIAVDLEFLAHRTTDTLSRPYCPVSWYDQLQQFVNNGDVVQIGLVFASSDPSRGAFLTVKAYEINLLVNVDSLDYNQDSVDFLKNQNHDLVKHKTLGVLPQWISAGLLRHLPFGDNRIIWLAYHGDKDIAFLLRLMQGGAKGIQLPTSLSDFNRQFTNKFPTYYDIKVLAQLLKEGFQGKLEDLAGDELLGLTKSKAEHHAGSDALLTIRCFMEILRRSSKNNQRVFARKGLLSGAEDLTLCIRCVRHVIDVDIQVVEVHSSNFQQEMLHFSQAVDNNFNIIVVQVLIPEEASAQDPNYTKMKSIVEEIQSFEVLVTFMNAEGNLAMGRVWKFFLQVQAYGDETRVEALQFAAVLASCRATHEDSTIWVTHRGAYGICCLMRSFVAPGDLPSTWVQYISSCSACFPSIYDIQVMTGFSPDHETTGNERSVAELADSLKISADSCDVITICRCFDALRKVVNLEEVGTGRLATAL